jgi:hypothetical protein
MQDRTRLVSKRGFINGSQQGKIIKLTKNKISKRNKNTLLLYCKKGSAQRDYSGFTVVNWLFCKNMQPHRFSMRRHSVCTLIYLQHYFSVRHTSLFMGFINGTI